MEERRWSITDRRQSMAEGDVFESKRAELESRRAELALPSTFLRGVSWSSIFAGVTAAIAVQLLLNLLGIGVGAASINPQQGQPGQGLAVGAAIWFVISCIISLFVGGWIAGRLAGTTNKENGALHGVVTWALASLALFYLLSTAVGGLLGGAASVLGQTASLAARGVQAVTPAATNLISQATGVTPEQVQSEAGDIARDSNFQAFVAGVVRNGQVTPQDRQSLASLLVSRRHMSMQDANATIDRWQAQIEQTVEQTKQTATQAETSAASGVSKGAFGSFFALLLGLASAVAGSWTGAQGLLRSRSAGPRVAG